MALGGQGWGWSECKDQTQPICAVSFCPCVSPWEMCSTRALPFPHLLLRCWLGHKPHGEPTAGAGCDSSAWCLDAEGLALRETALYWTTHSVLNWGQQRYLDFERNPGQTFEQSWTWLFAVGGICRNQEAWGLLKQKCLLKPQQLKGNLREPGAFYKNLLFSHNASSSKQAGQCERKRESCSGVSVGKMEPKGRALWASQELEKWIQNEYSGGFLRPPWLQEMRYPVNGCIRSSPYDNSIRYMESQIALAKL